MALAAPGTEKLSLLFSLLLCCHHFSLYLRRKTLHRVPIWGLSKGILGRGEGECWELEIDNADPVSVVNHKITARQRHNERRMVGIFL